MRMRNLLNTVRRQFVIVAIIGMLILGGITWTLQTIQNRLTVENRVIGRAKTVLPHFR
jgi:hypothetical protein